MQLQTNAQTSAQEKKRSLPSEHLQIDGIDGKVELRLAAGGFLQVWPRPSAESQQELYGEDFYETDKSDYLPRMQSERSYWDATWSMRRKLMESALPAEHRKILDVGSSGGFFLDHFKQHGWKCVGIEPSRSASRWAEENYGIETFTGELLDYPHSTDSLSSGEFDVIHSSQVLEHVLEPEACVERIASLLRPSGLVYIEVPNEFNAFQETARERLNKPAWWVAPKHHLNYFNYDSLAGLLKRYGLFEIDRLASFPIEMFLLMGDDYIGQPEVGAACHVRRMNFERALIETDRIDALLELYRAIAQAGLGRTCGILARKR